MSPDYGPLVERYAYIIKMIAATLRSRLVDGVDIDELTQAGAIGLIDAANAYDDSYDATFATYAKIRIRGAMLDELRARDWLPRSVRRGMRARDKAVQALSHRMGRSPGAAEVAGDMRMTIDDYHTLLATHHHGVFDEYVDTADEQHPASVVASSHPGPFAGPHVIVEREDWRAFIRSALEHLPVRERKIVRGRYFDGMTLTAIGAELGITESRVCQLQREALARLRAMSVLEHA